MVEIAIFIFAVSCVILGFVLAVNFNLNYDVDLGIKVKKKPRRIIETKNKKDSLRYKKLKPKVTHFDLN